MGMGGGKGLITHWKQKESCFLLLLCVLMKADFPGINPQFGDRYQIGELGEGYEKNSQELMSMADCLILMAQVTFALHIKSIFWILKVYFMYCTHLRVQFP